MRAAASRRPRRATSRTISAVLALGAAIPISMMESSRARASTWRRRSGEFGQDPEQRCGQPFGRAIVLQELRNNVLADHQVGEDDGFDLRVKAHDDLLDPRYAVGRNSRHPRERQFERDRAGRSQCHARRPECGHLLGLIDHDPWLDRPGRGALSNQINHVRHRRQNKLQGARALCNPLDRGAEYGQQPAHLAAATAGQHQDNRRVGVATLRRCGVGTQFGNTLDQRMADIAAWRPAESYVDSGLERQNSEHMVDIGAHRARAPRPPGPHRRRHIIEDGDRGRDAAHPPCDPVGKLRAVDDDERVRTRRDGRVRGFSDAAKNLRQPAGDGGESDDRQLVDRKWAHYTSRRHSVAANAREAQLAAMTRRQRARERCAENVARFFRRNDEDRKRRR